MQALGHQKDVSSSTRFLLGPPQNAVGPDSVATELAAESTCPVALSFLFLTYTPTFAVPFLLQPLDLHLRDAFLFCLSKEGQLLQRRSVSDICMRYGST